MFLAIARIPAGPAALQRAAGITGLAVPDVARALAGTLPRILLRATGEGPRLLEALQSAGFIAFLGEDTEVLTDARRIVARNLELTEDGLVAVDGRGQRHGCPAAAIHTLVRGHRLVESTEVTRTTQRKLSLGKALITGGLAVTKKVETTSERTTSAKEAFVVLQRDEGLPEIMLYEQRLNYQCLGAGIQPSTFANFTALLARLRSLAPHAALDDRITRPGFLVGLPPMALDPVDLALFLVSQARAHGCD
jgi:hypothetical protein